MHRFRFIICLHTVVYWLKNINHQHGFWRIESVMFWEGKGLDGGVCVCVGGWGYPVNDVDLKC